MLRSLILIWFLCLSSVGARTLEEGYRALERGDIETCRTIFAAYGGEEGKLARARLALTLGRPENALEHLVSDSLAARVTRLEALYRIRDFAEATVLLRQLEKEPHGAFEHPYDFRFYLYRGQVEARHHNYELAHKNYSEALRRARDANEKCRVFDKITELWLKSDELRKARASFEQTTALMDKVTDVWILASHLDTASELEDESGHRAAAVLLNRASRELYLSHNNQVEAALTLSYPIRLALMDRDIEHDFTLSKKMLDELLKSGSFRQSVIALDNFYTIYFNSTAPSSQRVLNVYEETIAGMPEGPDREMAILAYGGFLVEMGGHEVKAFRLLKEAGSSSSRAIRCRSRRRMATLFRTQGSYQQAREVLLLALEDSSTGMILGDRNWRCSRGVVLAQMAELEKNLHNYQRASELVQEALAESQGRTWLFWRVQTRQFSLMSAVEAYDIKTAQLEFSRSLADIEQLTETRLKVNALTLILAALSLNQSVQDDVLEPAELLLGDYGDVAREIVEKEFGKSSEAARFLTYFDQWTKDSMARNEFQEAVMSRFHKGIFLEALDRLEEAKLVLQLGLEQAKENDFLIGQMVSQLMLARVSVRQGHRGEAADYLTRAAQASQRLNPKAARFYLLSAAVAQREDRRFSEALQSFTKAIELDPKKCWSGLYGRAVTLETVGRYEEALKDVESAIVSTEKHGLQVSSARLRATKARLLNRLDRPVEALGLYEEVHEELSSLGATSALYQSAMDYGDCLLEQGKKTEALALTSGVLEHLSSLHSLTYREGKPLFERVVNLALASGQNEMALRFLQLSHSAEMLESVEQLEIKVSDQNSRDLLQEVSQLKRRLTKLQQNNGSGNAVSENGIGTILAQTRQEFFVKLNELRRSEPDFENLVQLSGSQLSSIQDLLSEQSALIEYFSAQDTLYLFVVTNTDFHLHQVSISRSDLDQLVKLYAEACETPTSALPELEKLSKRLRGLLVGSAESSLTGKTNLRIVPSGALWKISFSSLMDEDGEPLVEDYEVSYLSSSDLARIRRTGTGPSSRPQEPLLVSGATDLAGATDEVETLASELDGSLVLSPPTLRAFLDNVEGKDLIHIASHSNVYQATHQSSVDLGRDRLTLDEIYGLQLRPSCLVVLASCRSGVGVDSPGKEVTSLASAFSVAGASTVVASRWQVEDRSTTEFFSHFYRALLKGRYRGQAFREAERQMARKNSHPYFWAGFSLLGDPD